jgi:RNA polymerase sigma factor (sigma-70 family)
MAELSLQQGPAPAEITPEERARLLRYCAGVTGDVDAAEDLVQQTLLEAWQHAGRLQAPEARMPWLLGIARNMGLRWLRSRGREAARHAPLAGAADPSALPGATGLPAEPDPLAEIERSDLADLLDQALALLPPATRAVLVGRYLEDSSQAALAERLGLSEGAVEARIQRGKLALRRLLKTTFRDQLAAYGLDAAAGDGWEPTRVWCPVCGRRRLLAQFPPPPAPVAFRCPGCDPDPGAPRSQFRMSNAHFRQLIGGLSQPRAVLNRISTWVHGYYPHALEAGWVPCTNCGQRARLDVQRDPGSKLGQEQPYRLSAVCPACGEAVSVSFRGLVEALPATQRFWRRHGQIRALPLYEVEAGGQAAIVTRYQSVGAAATLTVVVLRDPFRLLSAEGDPADQENS